MTQQEFTARVKSEALKNVDANLYTKVIEPIYYMVDSDKDYFCAIFDMAFGKLICDSNTLEFLKELAWFYKSSMDYEKKCQQEKQDLTKEQVRLENLLITNGFEHLVDIPTSQLIRRKLSMGMGLTDAQKDYILEHLH